MDDGPRSRRNAERSAGRILGPMAHDAAPPEIIALAESRAAARRARDWRSADDLLAEIEAAGWKVVDSGTLYDLERLAPLDVVEGDIVRYGSSLSVPSRLDEPPAGVASVVLIATDWPDDVARAVQALATHSQAGTQVVVVANGPSEAQAVALADLVAGGGAAPLPGVEVVWTAMRLGWAAAQNVGIRRAVAPVVILMDPSVEPVGDLVSELGRALEDATVAVAGPFGLVSADLRRFEAAPDGLDDVDAIEGYAIAFRRSDYAQRGPLDEHFVFYRNLDIWWSLVLRDQAGDDAGDARPRRAVRVPSALVTRHVHRGWTSLPDDERDRASKKNLYRVLKRFATRRDLLVAGRASDPDAGQAGGAAPLGPPDRSLPPRP
jgi:hypothetical protein